MATSHNGEAPGTVGSRTILWCVPRTGSTALTKCLSNIEDNQVWFEPYCYCRTAQMVALGHAKIQLPPVYEGNEEIYQLAVNFFDGAFQCKTKPEYISYASIARFLETATSPHVFVKDMALSMNPADYKFFPKGYKHTFLIRHPLRVYCSYRKAMFPQLLALGMLTGEAADEKTFDVGRHIPFIDPSRPLFKDIYDIWKFVRENCDSEPVVIDGDDMLANPAEVLPKYCRAVGLPYNESMLKWEASADVFNKLVLPAAGLVEKFVYVYERAAKSGEFMPSSRMPSRDEVTPDVIRCTDEVTKYYDEMYATSIKI